MVALRNLAPANDDTLGSRDELETEVRHLQQAVVHLTRLSAIGTTAAMLVHELAQPISAASNYLAATQRLLENETPGPAEHVHDGVQLAQECLVRAADLMSSVKEAAASKAYQPRAVGLQVIIDDVMRMYAVGLGFPVRIQIAPSAAWVMGDRVRLAQVLSNLIRNAVDATEGQAVRSLRIAASINCENMVEVRVKDNGPGLPLQLKEKLFSPFVSTKTGGLGVGLSICRTIVEQHEGRIWAEALPLGTIFCFTLVPAQVQQK